MIKTSETRVFSPYLFNFNNNNIKEISLPTLSYSPKIDPSILGIFEKIEQIPFLPPYEEPKKEISIQAARLIVIRKRKMKKHKLRKLRIKMKFVFLKRSLRRSTKREKLFQDGLIAKMNEAKNFSAEAYVSDKLAKAKHVALPKTLRGKRYPEFLIKEILGIKDK